MKKLILLLCTVACFGQTPSIDWSRTFGGSLRDVPSRIIQTSDNGYILIGTTQSDDGDITLNRGLSDILIIKLDSEGNIIWKKTYGGSGSDNGNDILKTPDGGYVVCGDTNSTDGDISQNDGHGKCWVVKINAAGTIEWEKTIGNNYNDLSARKIIRLTDGNFAIAGYIIENDPFFGIYSVSIYMAKLSTDGSLLWEKYIGGYDSDFANSIFETADSGFIIGGETKSSDIPGHHGADIAFDYYIVKLDNQGNLVWQKSLGGGGDEHGGYTIPTTDGGYIATGSTYFSYDGDISGNNGGFDNWLVKLNALGIIEWQKCIGTAADEYLTGTICQTNDGSYLNTINRGSLLNTPWNPLLDGDPDANIIVSKLDSNGNTLWEKSLGGSLGDFTADLQLTSDGGSILCGHTFSNDLDVSGNHGDSDIWVVKLSQALSNNTFKEDKITVFPNPANSMIFIQSQNNLIIDKICITDALGKIIGQQTTNTNSINIENLTKGIYFLQAISGTNQYTTKFIKE